MVTVVFVECIISEPLHFLDLIVFTKQQIE